MFVEGKSRTVFFPSDTLIYGISRDGSKDYNIRSCEHMILGQLRMGARQTNYAPLIRGLNWHYQLWPKTGTLQCCKSAQTMFIEFSHPSYSKSSWTIFEDIMGYILEPQIFNESYVIEFVWLSDLLKFLETLCCQLKSVFKSMGCRPLKGYPQFQPFFLPWHWDIVHLWTLNYISEEENKLASSKLR